MTCYNLYSKKLNSGCYVTAGRRELGDCCRAQGEGVGGLDQVVVMEM